MNFWRDRRFLGTLAVGLFLVGLAVLTAVPRQPSPVERWWWEIVAPLEQMLSDALQGVGGTFRDVIRYPRMVREYKDLKSRLAKMQALQAELNLVRRENARLRNLLQLQRDQQIESTAASVIARSTRSWNSSLTLNQGSAEGVAVGDVVVVPAGLVGRVRAVSPRTCRVMLITSPESGLGVETVEEGYAGVTTGERGTEGLLRVTFFSRRAEPEVGDLLVTSHFGSEFPYGIPVSRVSRLITDEVSVTRQAFSEPVADMGRLHEVLIVHRPADQWPRWCWDEGPSADDDDDFGTQR